MGEHRRRDRPDPPHGRPAGFRRHLSADHDRAGAKMGKTAAGAVWLDAARTSPYDYYQFWINADDRDVARFLALFTLLPMDEVRAITAVGGGDARAAKRRLALEATRLAHGEDQARKAEGAAAALFSGAGDVPESALRDAPTVDFPAAELAAGGGFDLFHRVGLAKSRGEARRLVEGGGAYVGGRQVLAFNERVSAADAAAGRILLRVGKRSTCCCVSSEREVVACEPSTVFLPTPGGALAWLHRPEPALGRGRPRAPRRRPRLRRPLLFVFWHNRLLHTLLPHLPGTARDDGEPEPRRRHHCAGGARSRDRLGARVILARGTLPRCGRWPDDEGQRPLRRHDSRRAARAALRPSTGALLVADSPARSWCRSRWASRARRSSQLSLSAPLAVCTGAASLRGAGGPPRCRGRRRVREVSRRHRAAADGGERGG